MKSAVGAHYANTKLNPGYAADLTMAALKAVNVNVTDSSAMKDRLAKAYAELIGLPNAYRLYPVFPSCVSSETLFDAAKSRKQQDINSAQSLLFWPLIASRHNSAVDSAGAQGYLSARVALRNPENTLFDPLLHFFNLPYDTGNGLTQSWIPADVSERFEAGQTGFNLTTVTARDFLVMALMDRIEGKSNAGFILQDGWMLCPELGRIFILPPNRSVPNLAACTDLENGWSLGAVSTTGSRLLMNIVSDYFLKRVGFGFGLGLSAGKIGA
jgi:hypothetical protein